MSTGQVRALVRATRPRQWIKNGLVAAAPIAAAEIFTASVFGRTVAAMALFTAASGAVYLVNDSFDVEADRAHPTKALRPIAAGLVSVRLALATAALLAASALALGLLLDLSFGAVLLAYLLVNVGYSTSVKHVAWLELAVVAAGFILRAAAGGTATDLPLSAWFVAVVSGGSIFIVTGKRSAELARAGDEGRTSLDRYSVRSLRLARGVAAATAIVAYAMWVIQTNERVGWLALASLVFIAGSFARYDRLLESGMGEHPEDIFLHDRIFQALAGAWLAVYIGSIYG